MLTNFDKNLNWTPFWNVYHKLVSLTRLDVSKYMFTFKLTYLHYKMKFAYKRNAKTSIYGSHLGFYTV